MARKFRIAAILGVALAVAVSTAHADGWFDHLKAGKHKQLKEDFHAKPVDLCPPVDLMRVAHAIDVIEEGILDDGTVVIKQPDIWGQARMTEYRRDFEEVMKGDLGSFAAVLSARVARSDQASFESATTLAAALAASGGVDRNGILPGGGGGAPSGPSIVYPTPPLIAAGTDPVTAFEVQTAYLKSLTASLEAQTALNASLPAPPAPAAPSPAPSPPSLEGVTTAADLLDGAKLIERTAPFAAFGGQPFGNIADRIGGGNLGLEPTVYLDEKKRYLDHLNQIRRVNLGDDNADTAGYALYLIRMPISIQPGEKTQRGYGAVLNASVRPDFAPDFLYTTFRSLVVADLVDQLSPVVFGILERGQDVEQERKLAEIKAKKAELAELTKKRDTLLADAESIEDRTESVERRVAALNTSAQVLKRVYQSSPGPYLPPKLKTYLEQPILIESPTRSTRDERTGDTIPSPTSRFQDRFAQPIPSQLPVATSDSISGLETTISDLADLYATIYPDLRRPEEPDDVYSKSLPIVVDGFDRAFIAIMAISTIPSSRMPGAPTTESLPTRRSYRRSRTPSRIWRRPWSGSARTSRNSSSRRTGSPPAPIRLRRPTSRTCSSTTICSNSLGPRGSCRAPSGRGAPTSGRSSPRSSTTPTTSSRGNGPSTRCTGSWSRTSTG